MKSLQGAQDGSVNFYRADGLRARRVTGIGIGFNVDDQGAVSGYYDQFALDRPTWRYYHDGQAPFEDDVTYNPGSGTRKDVTRYALGARGGDMAEAVLAMGSSGERTVRSYPLYDGHGNTVAQIARAEDDAPGGSFVAVPGAPAFELGARRKYDAWGQVRWSEGSPAEQGYCGNLQHRRDAESGLVYMRARYYEPWTGRFISEDPERAEANWYVYCDNDPVSAVDVEGRSTASELYAIMGDMFKLVGGLLLGVQVAHDPINTARALQVIAAAIRTAKKAGNLLNASALKRFYIFVHAFNSSKTFTRHPGAKNAAATVIAGYMMLIEGYLYDVAAEFMDPYAPNIGLSENF